MSLPLQRLRRLVDSFQAAASPPLFFKHPRDSSIALFTAMGDAVPLRIGYQEMVPTNRQLVRTQHIHPHHVFFFHPNELSRFGPQQYFNKEKACLAQTEASVS
tara:strand:- start:238 stop:546 length:309 start_codon:yes stop_codon:yes gene_type:complete